MNDLLSFAIEAHGGLKRWDSVKTITADLSIGGELWEWKRLPGVFTDKTVVVDTTRQRVAISPLEGGTLVYTPVRVWMEDAAGGVLDERGDPAAAFAGQTEATPWDLFHAATFNGRALWTYLSQPFLYAAPGFEVEEIDPWREDGETWRSLRVTFPDHVFSHTRTQITRFGPDGLIRRHDYAVDLLGGATGVNYASNHRVFDGLAAPTRRRVYPADEGLKKKPGPLLVSIDIADIRFA